MKLKTLLSIHAIVELVFGFGALVAPELVVGLLVKNPLSVEAVYVTRVYGVLSLTLGIILWGARDEVGSPLVKAIVLAQIMHNVVAMSVTVGYLAAGLLSPLSWGNVVVWLALTVAYGYFLFRPARAEGRRAGARRR